MKTAPTNWTTIVNSGAFTYESKEEIAGSTIYQSAIYSLSVSGSAIGAEPASIGAALSGEIDLSISILDSDNPSDDLDGGTFIWTDGDSAEGGSFWSGGDDISGGFFDRGIYIPPMAYVEPYIRVKSTVNTDTSGWVKIGKYFIDTREKDVKSGKFTCHGYDAMLKAEQNYYASVSSGSMTTAAVVSDIATLIGVGVDTATTTILTTTSYDVPYYAGQYSAREILGYIGAAYCGSFIIDDNNNLRLVRLVDYGTNTNIGARARSFELSEQALTYDKVTVVIDPTHEWTAGSGNSELVFDCPFGTQAMANAVLSALSQYAYRGYSVGTAIITPLYDLGDSVTIKGSTVQIFNRTLRFNNLMASDLSAPYDEEINHEYVYKTATERKIERFQENVQSEFAITASEIASKVSQTDYNGNTIASLINQTATTVSIDASKLNFNGEIVNINAGGFNVTASGEETSFINLTYQNYNAQLNPKGFSMSYSDWNQESRFYNSGVSLRYDGKVCGFLGFATTGGNPTLVFYDTSGETAKYKFRLTSGTNPSLMWYDTDGSTILLNIDKNSDVVKEYGTATASSTFRDVTWTYRKWYSGVSECWGQVTQNVTSWSAWGNVYESVSGVRANWPSGVFIQAPTMTVMADASQGIMGVETYQGVSSTQTPSMYAVRPNSGETGYVYLHVYAIGRWKS